ncbi:MAG: hypothetical protein J3K34DRAFT_177610 [Monoraphidium minutum]|nr:MAG: hypothetical protein J3K34DRAFT_177610 [Monoraphidium minutum]
MIRSGLPGQQARARKQPWSCHGPAMAYIHAYVLTSLLVSVMCCSAQEAAAGRALAAATAAAAAAAAPLDIAAEIRAQRIRSPEETAPRDPPPPPRGAALPAGARASTLAAAAGLGRAAQGPLAGQLLLRYLTNEELVSSCPAAAGAGALRRRPRAALDTHDCRHPRPLPC